MQFNRQDPLLAAFDRLVAGSPTTPLVTSPLRSVGRAEVAALARAVGSILEASGLGEGALVGLAAPNGPGFLAAFVALRRAGVAVLMLDHSAPAEDRRRTARSLGARAIVSCSRAWPGQPPDFLLETLPAPHTEIRPPVAVVKLTSGSTGTARGVGVSMEALLADEAALASSMGLRDDERILGAIPLSHSYGLSSVTLPSLVRGSLLVVPDEAQPLAPLAAARHAEASFFPTAPAYLQALLKMSRPPAWPPSLRLVISASAPLSPATAARFQETYGQPVHVFYGASECGGICYDREGGAGERGTLGPPVDGVRVTLEPIGLGRSEAGVFQEGESSGIVVVSSPAVAEGYLPHPDPRLGQGRFVTSDAATWHEGELTLRGRIDGLINVKGKKVDPVEIQRVLEGLSGVEEVVALGVPGPENGAELVRAVIACRPGRLTYADVLAWCRSRLADHKVPRSVILVPEIPRNARGKVCRASLLALEGREASADSARG